MLTLAVDNSDHALTSTSPTPVELKTLEVNDSYHALSSMADIDSSYLLNEDGTMGTAEDGTHVITETAIQAPTLIELKTLVVNDGVHVLSSMADIDSSYLLNEDGTMGTAEDGTHVITETAIQAPTLIELKTLVVNDGVHVLSSEVPALTQVHTLAIADAYHSLISDNLSLINLLPVTMPDGKIVGTFLSINLGGGVVYLKQLD